MVPSSGPKKPPAPPRYADTTLEEAAGSADRGRQQRGGRLGRRHRVERHDLVDDAIEPAAEAGEEAGQCELVEAHHARVVADKLGALQIAARRGRDPAPRAT